MEHIFDEVVELYRENLRIAGDKIGAFIDDTNTAEGAAEEASLRRRAVKIASAQTKRQVGAKAWSDAWSVIKRHELEDGNSSGPSRRTWSASGVRISQPKRIRSVELNVDVG